MPQADIRSVHSTTQAGSDLMMRHKDLRKQIASAKAEPAPIALEECRPRLDHLAALLREVSPTLPKREQQVLTEVALTMRLTTHQLIVTGVY